MARVDHGFLGLTPNAVGIKRHAPRHGAALDPEKRLAHPLILAVDSMLPRRKVTLVLTVGSRCPQAQLRQRIGISWHQSANAARLPVTKVLAGKDIDGVRAHRRNVFEHPLATLHPGATIDTTDAMPMMMPNMVGKVRKRCPPWHARPW